MIEDECVGCGWDPCICGDEDVCYDCGEFLDDCGCNFDDWDEDEYEDQDEDES